MLTKKGKRITKSRPIRIRDRRDLDYKTANGCTRYNKIIKNCFECPLIDCKTSPSRFNTNKRGNNANSL